MKKRKSDLTFATQITVSISSLRRRGINTWRVPLLCYSAFLITRAQSFPIHYQWLFPQWFCFSLEYFKGINLTPDNLNSGKLYSFALCKFSFKPLLTSLRREYYWGKILKIRYCHKNIFPFQALLLLEYIFLFVKRLLTYQCMQMLNYLHLKVQYRKSYL